MPMKRGTCPKCHQRNVYACKDGEVMMEDGQTFAQVNPQAATMFVCDDCRYTESYLDDGPWPKSLKNYEGWERVSPPADGPFR